MALKLEKRVVAAVNISRESGDALLSKFRKRALVGVAFEEGSRIQCASLMNWSADLLIDVYSQTSDREGGIAPSCQNSFVVSPSRF